MGVLLLDSTYEPLRIISWMKAMSLIVAGNAEVLEEDDNSVIRSVKVTYKMPCVIRQLSKFKRKRDTKFSRLNLYLRDRWTCQYCGDKKLTKELTFDHVIPKNQGGLTNWINIVAACRSCNNNKADRTPEEAGMRLLNQPFKPVWLPAQVVIRQTNIPDKWMNYLDEKYLDLIKQKDGFD
jgi:5-methylcytosine-specific restriction endonuclease McrA